MASVHRTDKSKYWHCSYYDSTAGKWRLRSTGSADKAEAQSICLRFESLAGEPNQRGAGVPEEEKSELVEAGLKLIQVANRGELGEATAREFVNRVLKASGQNTLAGETVRSFLDNWLSGKSLSKTTHTAQRYKTPIEFFKTSLGRRADAPLSAVIVRDVELFRDMRMKDVSNITIACDLKILRTAFNAARRQGLIHANPVEAVEIPKGESKKREAFTVEEVQNILAAINDPEWKTAILLGFYAGLRLGDSVSMDWSNIDLSKSLLRYRATKTKRMEEVPLHPVLEKHLKSLNGTAKGKLCPKLHGEKIPGRSGLSRQFLEIVDAAGIDKMSQGKARLKGRRFTGKTFHSLRHGFISALANAGVAPELRQKLSGHSDADVHQQYTHLELETLRSAINSIKPPTEKDDGEHPE